MSRESIATYTLLFKVDILQNTSINDLVEKVAQHVSLFKYTPNSIEDRIRDWISKEFSIVNSVLKIQGLEDLVTLIKQISPQKYLELYKDEVAYLYDDTLQKLDFLVHTYTMDELVHLPNIITIDIRKEVYRRLKKRIDKEKIKMECSINYEGLNYG